MPFTKALWVSERGETLLPNGICQILKRLAKRANIEGIHPHCFRHSYDINALRAGVPEQVLKIVAGRGISLRPTSRPWGRKTPLSSTGR